MGEAAHMVGMNVLGLLFSLKEIKYAYEIAILSVFVTVSVPYFKSEGVIQFSQNLVQTLCHPRVIILISYIR
jgi:hypothetical protein